MVALNSTRRQSIRSTNPVSTSIESLAGRRESGFPAAIAAIEGSRRESSSVEVSRDATGAISRVRIGRWRVLAAAPERRILEVRELGCRKVAIRLSRSAAGLSSASGETWQLYDQQGRMQATMQCSQDGGFALVADYQTRQASRLRRNLHGELETVETWNI